MEVSELKNKWLLITDQVNSTGYRSIRIDSECLPSLYLGINKDGNRCLLLALPMNTSLESLL